MERVKDWLLMQQEYIKRQEEFKPQQKRKEEETEKIEELRGNMMDVGNLEEFVDEDHCIVSTNVGTEHYVAILSIVDKD